MVDFFAVKECIPERNMEKSLQNQSGADASIQAAAQVEEVIDLTMAPASSKVYVCMFRLGCITNVHICVN